MRGLTAARSAVPEAQPLRLIAAQVAEDRVRGRHEPFEDLAPGRVLEVQGDGALVAVERLEEEAVGALLAGRDVATDVAARARDLRS